ncbi:hypothetical protein OPT61_g2210 [Boeremia exigua]|uniref:Uncharacterized protein n=1 Tax=Boeremia exigua TaxID=749465 RepID=A0ACC2IMH8_9PLEO|nr:hypothetical protein OPT61_g2210 [Boeremia exigua]
MREYRPNELNQRESSVTESRWIKRKWGGWGMRVGECWSDGSSVTRQPPATSMTKLSLSAGVLVRARAAHEAEPLAFQVGPAVMEALPNASLLHRAVVIVDHVMPGLGTYIPAVAPRPCPGKPEVWGVPAWLPYRA